MISFPHSSNYVQRFVHDRSFTWKNYFPLEIAAMLFLIATDSSEISFFLTFISSKSKGRNGFYAAHTCIVCGQRYLVCDVILYHLLWCCGEQNRKTSILLYGMLFVSCVSSRIISNSQTCLSRVSFNFKLGILEWS